MTEDVDVGGRSLSARHSVPSTPAQPPVSDLLKLYRTMLTVRLAEERFMRGLSRGEFPGFYFPVQGMEAAAVGVIAALRPDDYYVTTYRGVADVLAKGASLEAVFGELLGRVTGMSRGKGGTMHMADPERGMMLTTGIVGSGPPIANGLGLAAQLRGDGRVTGVSFGDGATSIGALHEALNLASLWNLPVIFVCHNNLWGECTPLDAYTKTARLAERASPFGPDPRALLRRHRRLHGRSRRRAGARQRSGAEVRRVAGRAGALWPGRARGHDPAAHRRGGGCVVRRGEQ
jgi:TPP-dependent pyruvate/acetoin dehydrogenase alpha subunit